jgi:hypothetical protein
MMSSVRHSLLGEFKENFWDGFGRSNFRIFPGKIFLRNLFQDLFFKKFSEILAMDFKE